MIHTFVSRCNEIFIEKKVIFGVDGFLQNLYDIRQHDINILTKVDKIMTQNGCFACKELNKRKRKRKRKNIDSC